MSTNGNPPKTGGQVVGHDTEIASSEWVATSIAERGTNETVKAIVALLDVDPDRHDLLLAAYGDHPEVQRRWAEFNAVRRRGHKYEHAERRGNVGRRFAGILNIVLRSYDGQRNVSLYSAAGHAAEMVDQGDITRDQAETALVEAARHVGLTEREARATISSAFKRQTGGYR